MTLVDGFARSRFLTLAGRQPTTRDADVEQGVVQALQAVTDTETGEISPAVADAVTEAFHKLYYASTDRTWRGGTTYRGTTVWKCPLDLWLYQELLHSVEPALIIETGTAFGGSARYLGDLCDLLDRGRIVTIDTQAFEGRFEHPRVTYVAGSSTSDETVARLEELVPAGEPVLLILDSDHTRDHVLAELRTLSRFVTVGSCIIVEDTNINGHPVYRDFGPGPMEALEEFLRENSDFEVDPVSEKFFMTFNPRGVLRRVR